MSKAQDYKIKIQENGPYIVYGDLPLYEYVITNNGGDFSYTQKKRIKTSGTYALCRCGRTKNPPFCDGFHLKKEFNGKEVASRESFLKLAETIQSETLILKDYDELCAFVRLCHSSLGSTWQLLKHSEDEQLRKLAIKTAQECPAGRLVIYDRQTNLPLEIEYEPSIVILQDPHQDCSGPIWVRGNVQIEAADGFLYERRNRVTLCRCGRSFNKPFCDAAHIMFKYKDKD